MYIYIKFNIKTHGHVSAAKKVVHVRHTNTRDMCVGNMHPWEARIPVTVVWLLIFVGIKFSWILLGFLFTKFHMHGV